MPRYKLTIAYDGTDFCGWQKQEPPAGMEVGAAKVLEPATPDESGTQGTEDTEQDVSTSDELARIKLRTVQEIVERVVRRVVREPVNLIGASRTDSGVHARGQVAAFTCSDSAWPAEREVLGMLRALNSRLPEDVQVLAVERVADSFNPISNCIAKGYAYTLYVSPHRPLWERRFVKHVRMPLDAARMNDAAARFVGEHDFVAFAAAGHGRVSTVRTVFECRVIESGTAAERQRGTEESARRVRIEISGNGFLWNMVRIIAGTLVEVGRGRMTPEDVAAAIESKDRRKAGPTLPPTGLCLEWVRYPQ